MNYWSTTCCGQTEGVERMMVRMMGKSLLHVLYAYIIYSDSHLLNFLISIELLIYFKKKLGYLLCLGFTFLLNPSHLRFFLKEKGGEHINFTIIIEVSSLTFLIGNDYFLYSSISFTLYTHLSSLPHVSQLGLV